MAINFLSHTIMIQADTHEELVEVVKLFNQETEEFDEDIVEINYNLNGTVVTINIIPKEDYQQYLLHMFALDTLRDEKDEIDAAPWEGRDSESISA